MLFNYIDEIKTSIVMNLGEWMGNFNEKKNGELYYVYAYTTDDVYITKQGSKKVELLEGVSQEFKRNLAEGFILRYKNRTIRNRRIAHRKKYEL